MTPGLWFCAGLAVAAVVLAFIATWAAEKRG